MDGPDRGGAARAGEASSLLESSARRRARVHISLLTPGRGRETKPEINLYGWAKFRLKTSSKNPHNSRTKGAECGEQKCLVGLYVASPDHGGAYVHLRLSKKGREIYHRLRAAFPST